MQFTAKLLIPALLLLISTVRAAEPAPAVGPEQLKSPAWWRQQAVHYADGITDADAKGRAHYELVYLQGFAGDFDGARASTESVNNLQLRMYSHLFLAKQHKKKGDDHACQSELQEAGKVMLARENGSDSTVILTYLKMGQPDEAISLAAKISTPFHRNCEFQYIAAELARQGKLEMAYEVVKQRLPKSWEQSCWSVMANACADELQIDEAQKLASRLTDPKLQDRVYNHLFRALLKADRDEEAGQFADRISDTRRKANAHAQLTAKSAKMQNVEVLQSRFEKVTTREDKLAIYNLLFAKLVEAGNIEAAEQATDSMIKNIEDFPQEPEISKFGSCDDTAVTAMVKIHYLTIAKLLAEKGDREGSLLRIAKAQKAITELSNNAGVLKSLLVGGLVTTQIERGDLDGARASLAKLDKSFMQSSIAAEVAVGLIKSGDVKSGLEIAQLITESTGKETPMGKVAIALIRAKELDAAKTLLRNFGDGYEDVEAFRDAGHTLAELGLQAELLQWIDELPSNAARAYLCMGAARVD